MIDKAAGRPAVVQRRRIERVKAILDAAEALLGEQGYEAATLKAIGERAGIPTASVYHYYRDRGEVETELLQRHVTWLRERIAARLGESAPRSVRDTVDAVIDPLFDYGRRNPAFVQLWRERGATLAELGRAFDESVAEQTWRVLVKHRLIDADTPLYVMQCAFEAGDRLFDLAFERSPGGDETTMNEARRLVTAYLETYAPQED
ncbi:TetR/AcrR family transcriptional regulator [Streptomyces sp. NPDC048604]|uniref:TetR/AcrR family transcriptional regulator n=1 Tax=Streptomyces sp. NPDC048604 TaxID=3365578 RepID=UPI00370FACA0